MTKDEALKLALEAMESVTVECNNFHHPKKDQNHDWAKCPPVVRWDKAIIAIKEALAQPEQIQPSADSNTHQPERHELQAKGEHPAPCARHCEANAFQIVIKNLKAQLAQRKPLTDEEISEIAINNLPMVHEFARAIEAAHGIKENT